MPESAGYRTPLNVDGGNPLGQQCGRLCFHARRLMAKLDRCTLQKGSSVTKEALIRVGVNNLMVRYSGSAMLAMLNH